MVTFETVVQNSVHDQLAELATNASARGGEALECATAVSGEIPLFAAYLFSPVPHGPFGGWWFATGTMFDLVLLVAAGLKGLVRRLRRRPAPTQIVAIYRDRVEILTWRPESTDRGSPTVVPHKVGGGLIYVGAFTVRIARSAWGISERDRDELVAVMLRSAWRPQLVRVG